MSPQEALTRQIWVGMVDSERAVRYCTKLASKMKLRYQMLSTFLTVMACGAIAPVLAPVPQFIAGIALAFVAVLSVWFLLADYSGKAATSRAVSDQYQDLVSEWRALWYGEATQEDIVALQRRFDQVHRGGDLGNDRALNEEAMNEAEEILWGQLEGAPN